MRACISLVCRHWLLAVVLPDQPCRAYCPVGVVDDDDDDDGKSLSPAGSVFCCCIEAYGQALPSCFRKRSSLVAFSFCLRLVSNRSDGGWRRRRITCLAWAKSRLPTTSKAGPELGRCVCVCVSVVVQIQLDVQETGIQAIGWLNLGPRTNPAPLTVRRRGAPPPEQG
jgi:hypothetical protein